jgi:Recombinase
LEVASLQHIASHATNPVYAGAYAFGRTGSRVTIEAGRKRIVRGFRKEREAWEVLIPHHHEGYIDWVEFERNQRLISDNANGRRFMSRGSVGVASHCWQACCAAAIAAASCTSPTVVRTEAPGATTAVAGI